MVLSRRAYSARSSEECADGERRRFREIISIVMDIANGPLVSRSRDNRAAEEQDMQQLTYYL
jgi:hypothetical protein